MARIKRDKPRFWCRTCRLVGYRRQDEADAKAALTKKEVWPCPDGYGFHFGGK